MPVDRVLALGAEDYEGGDPAVFNMAVMGMRLAQRANGVSKLHGEVSRGMFDGLWPGFDDDEVPITSVTNGVHAPTWVAREVVELGERRGRLVADRGGARAGRASSGSPTPTSGTLRRTLRAQLVVEGRRRVRESWMPPRRERRRARLDRRACSTRTC